MSEPTGMERLLQDYGRSYQRCTLDTPAKQEECSEFRVTPSGWCAWGRCDDDACRWREERNP